MVSIMARLREPQFVRKVHELIRHVLVQWCDEVKTISKEQVCRGSGNGAAIRKHLAMQPFHHRGNRYPIIDVTLSKITGWQIVMVTRGQVQLEVVKRSPYSTRTAR